MRSGRRSRGSFATPNTPGLSGGPNAAPNGCSSGKRTGSRRKPDFKPVPYQEFTAHPDAAETFISLLYTIFGNLDDLAHARPQIEQTFKRVDRLLELVPELRISDA